MAKRRNACAWAMAALFIIAGMVCGLLAGSYFYAQWEKELTLNVFLLDIIIFLAIIYLAVFLQVIIHELGHLACGLLTHYRFSSFRAGWFALIRDKGKFKLKLFKMPGTMGQCLMVPPDMENGQFPFVLYNLGGALFNALSALIFALLFFLCENIPFLPLFLLAAAVIGLTYAFANGVPMRNKMVANDGYNLLSIYKNPRAAYAFWVQLKAAHETAKGTRLKDMPKDWFSFPPEEDLKNSMCAVIAVFCANRLMDEHDFARAREMNDKLRASQIPLAGIYRGLLACDRIYCECLGDKSPEVLNALLNAEQLKFMNSMKNSLSVLRTQYALKLLYEQDNQGAEKIKMDFERYAANYPYEGDAQSERELMLIAEQAALGEIPRQ